MKEILFYKSKSGKSPIEAFLETLSLKEVEKVTWVLQLIEESHSVSTKFYKKLVNTDDIVEIRIQHSNNNFRFLGFEHKGNFIILTNAFRKKDQKTPKKEIDLAEKRKEEYLSNE
jgi:phage-related protein